ncbi:hypothetical protein FSS13T_27330 [Flavobacterium saliperosum S13]|uniref:Uncharacterized protein n=2 Tax=Flavobacterium saliperosum TaxID=329186 RepID=A0A1G4WAG3_9FLAO|nr:hypothetical protein [Flavobacterium saliperosum]ESU21159.1 hypothetical protein FSS13T_27330 [Flavobacterium saliperosum S13]SCX19411.1 hypothetical protein SAMN02927925_02798 [Flavobacterium saliperosum]
MKNSIRLKSLISISLLIFVFPFLQTCSDATIKKNICLESKELSPVVDSIHTANNLETNKNLYQEKKDNHTKENVQTNDSLKDKKSCLERARNDNTCNAYYLGFGNLNEFEFRYLSDKTFYIFLNFTIIILLTIFMLIISFRKKFKQIIIISSINLLLLIVATISLYLIEVIEDLNQIKYGYYLFVLNSLLIIFESRKELNKQTEK